MINKQTTVVTITTTFIMIMKTKMVIPMKILTATMMQTTTIWLTIATIII